MPNWCNNYLELEHDDPEMITRARKAFDDGRLLDEFVPVPKSLHIVAGCVGDPDEQKKLEEDTAKNLEVHGYGNWYDYCVNEWGTKWDVGGDGYTASVDGPNTTVMVFDSAWAPPCSAMEKFVELGFNVKLYYYESGMCFAGCWDNGADDFYELSGMSIDDIEAELPYEIDVKFCIVDAMREWEEENADEPDEVQVWYEDGVEKQGLEPHTKEQQ